MEEEKKEEEKEKGSKSKMVEHSSLMLLDIPGISVRSCDIQDIHVTFQTFL